MPRPLRSAAPWFFAIALVAMPWMGGCETAEETSPPANVPPTEEEPASSAVLTNDSGGEAELPLSDGDEVSLDVPPGAVDDPIEVALTEVDAADLPALEGDAQLTTSPVAFTPHGTTFDTPVTITFTLSSDAPADAVMVRLDDESDTNWELVPSTRNGDTISAEVTSFSIYAIADGDVCDQNDPDSDDDGICDSADPCPDPDDPDSDDDGICDSADPCPDPNDPDTDDDGICDSLDPCAAPSDDTDGNGICDDTEVRISGTITEQGQPVVVTVTLYTSTQAVAGTTTTDAAGAYFFGGLAAEEYQVSVSDVGQCLYGTSPPTTTTLGDFATIDLTVGCF